MKHPTKQKLFLIMLASALFLLFHFPPNASALDACQTDCTQITSDCACAGENISYSPDYTSYCGTNGAETRSFDSQDACLFFANNCKQYDSDLDGYVSESAPSSCLDLQAIPDCDDTRPYVNPGVLVDYCNKLDDNCNGQIDEDCSVAIPDGTKRSNLIYENGAFYSCNKDASEIDAPDGTFSSITLEKGSVCEEQGTFYCAPKDTEYNINNLWLKKIPYIYKVYDYDPSTDTGYMCHNGELSPAVRKETVYRDRTGFCPGNNYCLYDITVTEYGPVNTCIETDNYKENFYCNEGTWTSRTKLIAQQLASYAEDTGKDYVLNCDKKDLALNSLGLEPGKIEDKTNNFCTLKILNGDKTINEELMGVSLNTEINHDTNNVNDSFLSVLSTLDEKITSSYCDDALASTDDSFVKCRDGIGGAKDGLVWYNKKTGIALFSKTPFDLSNPSVFGKVWNFFANFFGKTESVPAGGSEFNLPVYSNRIYISKSNNKYIIGAVEKKYDAPLDEINEVMSVEYTNFNSDMCKEAKINVPVYSCTYYDETSYETYGFLGPTYYLKLNSFDNTDWKSATVFLRADFSV